MTEPLIQFTDVRKRFGTHEVLKGVNLSIYRGQILAVNYLFPAITHHLAAGLQHSVRPDSGKILIKGRPFSELPGKTRRAFQKELSYMFQDNALFDFLTIYDNIALPLTEDPDFPKGKIDEKVSARIDQLGLCGTESKFPAQLSGGMRKRVALARALVTDPNVVLFDEPTTGLDPVRKKKVHSMIQEYQEQFGFTAVIVSHDIPQIFDVAQRIAMLDNGIIKFEGSKQDILNSHSKILNAFLRGENI